MKNLKSFRKKVLALVLVLSISLGGITYAASMDNVYVGEEALSIIRETPRLNSTMNIEDNYGVYIDENFDTNVVYETIENFLKFIPDEYDDFQILIPGQRSNVINGLHIKYHPDSYMIILTESASTVYHEFGHYVEKRYRKQDPGLAKYGELLKRKPSILLEKSREGDNGWSNKYSESFAEDFQAYVSYSLTGASLDSVKKKKRTNYELVVEMFDVFDEMFPDIRDYRLKNKGDLEKTHYSASNENNWNDIAIKRVLRSNHSEWSSDYIYSFYSDGLFINKGSEEEIFKDSLKKGFKGDVTREEFAKMIVSVYERNFNDIDVSSVKPYNDANDINILKATSLGVINGVGGNNFKPNAAIKRGDLFLMLDRFEKLIEVNADVDRSILRNTTKEEAIKIMVEINNKLND